MVNFIGPEAAGYIRIKESKYWRGEKPGEVVKKHRTRVISNGNQTGIGRIDISKLTKEALLANKDSKD